MPVKCVRACVYGYQARYGAAAAAKRQVSRPAGRHSDRRQACIPAHGVVGVRALATCTQLVARAPCVLAAHWAGLATLPAGPLATTTSNGPAGFI